MARYLFIESQDPLEDRGATDYLGYALGLVRKENSVVVFFVENGVNAVRKGSRVPVREELRKAGATLNADEFALRERGIDDQDLAAGVAAGGVGRIVDLLADP
ncbi:MAG: DsrE family protein, partial [SAR324 cluster bacterium]|nr:DsrE family protein [SAR324 cluster bacterium]